MASRCISHGANSRRIPDASTRSIFGNREHRWNHRTIDSRESRFTNKALIEQDIKEYGIESDYVRVRIRGLPPAASELQFIERARILAAQQREVVTFADDPLIAGFDVSGGGSAWNVVRFRRGMDARSIPPIRVPGEHSRDRGPLLSKLAEIMSDDRPGYNVAVMFVDSAYGAPYVERLHVLGFDNVVESTSARHLSIATRRTYGRTCGTSARSGCPAGPLMPPTRNWRWTWAARARTSATTGSSSSSQRTT